MSNLPKDWESFYFSEVCELNPRKQASDYSGPRMAVTFVPMAAVDATTGTIDAPIEKTFSEVSKGFTAFRENDVILAKITPCMENGKAAIARNLINGFGFGSTEFHVFRSKGSVLPEYIFYFIRQERFRKDAERNFTGSVGQRRVPLSFLEESVLPVPPLNEQKRIVEKLEKLLGKAEAAQERLNKIPAILKRFRQSVLAAACSGKLTSDWRGTVDEDLPYNWDYIPLNNVIRISSGEAFKKSEYSTAGARLFQIANVSFGQVVWNQKNFLPLSYLRTHKELSLNEGDIVLALNRPLLNWRIKVARVSSQDLPAILYQRVGRVHVLDNERGLDSNYVI